MSRQPPIQSVPHDSTAAPSTDRSPTKLNIPLSQSLSEGLRDSPSRVKRISNAVEKTVDKLSKSISGTIPRSQSPPQSPGHRRIFSLSRKNKDSDNGICVPRLIIFSATNFFYLSFFSYNTQRLQPTLPSGDLFGINSNPV